ncbi:DUF3667 domain-containing protein [Sphingobacterium sp. SRCM116780]|uniref:DUF3667 domain-containing protein n=1 Tax=Sphingobacterium sp. SRCM116780 TaxID=2907623 RepID=UPI001F22E98B|nr:DUF3667 domain-containing protein [Sphingobacterium sp. SRCM116780]UIR56394.1 DUF3667 domain-containing protein [Sphingobacterium sp. SRCM116780]
MTKTCKNCTQHFKGNFCNTCGQSADTHEINTHFLWHDIQHGLLHFDNGIFYTIKQLFTRPGHTIREFIDGKRIRHFKPLSLVIILATIYGLLIHNFNVEFVPELQRSRSAQEINFYEEIKDWISGHYSWATLIFLPFYAFGSFVVYKKQHRNFIEHLVLNAFLAGQRLVLHIITFPLLYIYKDTSNLSITTGILTLLDFVLLFWGYSQFFNKISKPKNFLLTLLTFLIFTISLIIIGILVGASVALLITKK